MEVVADVVQDRPQHLQLRVLLVVLRDLADVLHQDGVQVGHVSAQVAFVVTNTAQSVDPVFRSRARREKAPKMYPNNAEPPMKPACSIVFSLSFTISIEAEMVR